MNGRQKRMRWMILILFLLAVVAILLMPRDLGNAQAFESGYPPPEGFPAPVNPWCEEAMLLEVPLPTWCAVVVTPVATATAWAYPAPMETVQEATPGAVKIGGRMKQERRR